jgi:hypothetical protein
MDVVGRDFMETSERCGGGRVAGDYAGDEVFGF